jgi:cell division protein FtsB
VAKAKKDDAVQPDTLQTTDATEPVLPEPNPELEQLRAEITRLNDEVSDLIEQVNQQRAANTTLKAEIARLNAELDKLKSAPPPPPAKPGAGSTRAKVSVPNTHFGSIVVDIPADAANPHAAAIEAAKQARGVVSFGAGPHVEFLN